MHTQNQPHHAHSNPAPEAPPTPVESSRHEGLWSVIGTILLIASAPLIAVVITLFVFQSYEVDGPSMQNTLHHQDRLIVYKLPKTFARITGKTYMPKRHDIIVFKHSELSEDAAQHPELSKQLIKRVIALPGERVVVANNTITVYNQEHQQGFNPDAGTEYESTISITPGKVDLVVPEDEIFAVGDNRTNSLDSRYFGAVPTKDIAGVLTFRLWPNSKTF